MAAHTAARDGIVLVSAEATSPRDRSVPLSEGTVCAVIEFPLHHQLIMKGWSHKLLTPVLLGVSPMSTDELYSTTSPGGPVGEARLRQMEDFSLATDMPTKLRQDVRW